MNIGIVGLPNVGKSTIFKALTKKQTLIANYPFATIDPSQGIVEVNDPRIFELSRISESKKTVPATITFVDIAGLVKGASQGEGLGNKFLSHIRQVDAIVHVVRSFVDDDVSHIHGSVNPIEDFEVILIELAMADLNTVEQRMEKNRKQMKNVQPVDLVAEQAILQRFQQQLQQGKGVREILAEDDVGLSKELSLLTAKPYFVIQNCGEDLGKLFSEDDFHCPVIQISAKIEAELAELSYEEAQEFMKELGVETSGLDKVIKTGYDLLGLITYFTSGEPESRAWTIVSGTKAPQAAAVIHTDFEKKFIAAEIAMCEDFVSHKGWSGVRESGTMRLEGKEYVMRDGDVCFFKIGR